MDFTGLALVVVMPMIVAYIVVILALACKYHPLSRAVIIPNDALKKTEPLASDLNTKHKLFATIAIGVGVAIGLSLYLTVVTHYEFFETVLGPLLALMKGVDGNFLALAYVLFLLVLLTPQVLRSLTWMTPLRGALVGVLCAAIFLAWVLVDSWITFNLMVVLVLVLMALILQQRISFLRLSLILFFLAVLYDAWQVYGTGNMVEVATNMKPVIGAAERQFSIPAMLLLPDSLSLTPQRYGVLGGGDVVVFSTLAVSAARFGRKIGSWMPVVLAFAGFAVAMIVSSLVVWYSQSGQPATIYIVPLCALPVMLYARWKGNFDLLSVPFYEPAAAAPRNK